MTESSSKITFKGTRNTALTSGDPIPFIYGLTYASIADILRLTPAFRSVYDAEVVPEEHQDAYYAGEWMEYYSVPDVKLIRGSLIQPDVDALTTNTGLIGTVLTAFNLHQNLQFRPDDVWVSILAQFSAYVNGRGEELRSRIVDFEGQKALEVTTPGDIFSANFGATNLVFLDEITANIKDPTLKDWFLPGYSTTTQTDEICAAAMAMCTFQQYFTYKFGLICGIPQITLLGTVEDWQLLREKIERLVEFDGEDKLMSEKWVPILREILDNFLESARNGSNNNLDFWNQIVSNTGAACGGPELLTGWVSAFSVFNDKGELYADMDSGSWPVIRLDDIYHNVASCPATVDDNGKKYNATLFVGQMAYDFIVDQEATQNPPEAVAAIDTQDGSMRMLRPRNDWALAISDGFIVVPAKDPEEDQQGPPDGTFIWGDECHLDPYNYSGGIYYEVNSSPPSLSPGNSSSDSWDEIMADDDRPTNQSIPSQASQSPKKPALISSMSVLVALALIVLIFVTIRKNRGAAAATTNPKGDSKLTSKEEESCSAPEHTEDCTARTEQPRNIFSGNEESTSAEDGA